jgi:hypothetical protein
LIRHDLGEVRGARDSWRSALTIYAGLDTPRLTTSAAF